jgi:hypothetical protein
MVVVSRFERLLVQPEYRPAMRVSTARPLVSGRITVRPPWGLLRLASRAPQWMVRIPARLIAGGPRPEHAPAFARR